MSADCPAGRLPKPVMRGLLQSQLKKNILVGVGLAAISGILMKIFVVDARKQKYADFYKTYNAEEDYKRMKRLGLFQSP